MLKFKILICLFLFSISWDINPRPFTPDQDFPINGIWQKQQSPGAVLEFMTVASEHQFEYHDTLGIQVQGLYELHGKQIYFNDTEGNVCNSTGIYNFSFSKDTLKLSFVKDDCEGRINGISGLWIRTAR